jgi:pimeloyl-ACP methyl ester carboxylesterase
VIEHAPTETILYKWFSYVPRGLDRDATAYILITGLHGNMSTYEEAAATAKLMLQDRLGWPYIDRFVLLVPVIPRRDTPHVYPVAFDVQNFREGDDFYSRADLKVNQMIDTLAGDLANDGYQVSDKVFIEGFSAGAMFAQRYALLHPSRVKAIAAGQCGGNFTLPESSYQGQTLNWPVGISNLEALTGLSFDQASYVRVAQFIYIGDQDTGEGGTTIVWNRDWGPGYMWESVDQLDFLKSNFGETDPVRLKNQTDYLYSTGYRNITFRLYEGVAHSQTGQMVRDAMAFLDAQR